MKVSVAVSAALSAVLLDTMATVGATSSIVIEGVSVPAVLALPATSAKDPAATPTVPLVAPFGTNVAVYTAAEPAKPVIVPPVTATSAAVKVVEGLLSVNVIRAVPVERISERSLVIVIAGATEVTVIAAALRPMPLVAGLPAGNVCRTWMVPAA